MPPQSCRFTFGGANRTVSSFSLGGTADPFSARHQGARSRQLCPSLAVPDGMELVCAIRDLLTKGRQQVSFSIVDIAGQPLSHAIVNETGAHCGMQLLMLDQTPLASIRTSKVHSGTGLPDICWPSGEVFCSLVREERGGFEGYSLRDKAGSEIYMVHGNIAERVINIVSPDNRVVCDTEPCSLEGDPSLYFQVRVAPRTDACLILCALLAVTKLEGSGMPGSLRSVVPGSLRSLPGSCARLPRPC